MRFCLVCRKVLSRRTIDERLGEADHDPLPSG